MSCREGAPKCTWIMPKLLDHIEILHACEPSRFSVGSYSKRLKELHSYSLSAPWLFWILSSISSLTIIYAKGKYHSKSLNGESIKIAKGNKIKMETLEPKHIIIKMKSYLTSLSQIREIKINLQSERDLLEWFNLKNIRKRKQFMDKAEQWLLCDTKQ